MIKFSQMPYARPDLDKTKAFYAEETECFRNAKTFEEAEEAFLKVQEEEKHYSTMATIAQIRHDIDSTDAFYDEEARELAKARPMLRESTHAWEQALLASPFRKDFEKKYGEVMFLNLELEARSFSPEIVPDMQEESLLCIEYSNLLASAQIEFEGSTYTLAQMTPFKQSKDDAQRRSAWIAEGAWYTANGEKLDEIYDKLVAIRTRMAKKLGFDNYIPLGYLRMQRNCYDQKDVEAFRASVRENLVPVAEEVCKKQAERLGVQYPLSFADEALFYRSGNARPVGTADDILANGRKFYHELSPETAEFIDVMLDGELMDVVAKKGKVGGGYCTSLPDYKVPFIFSNFNGTQGDVEVITHEAGHAFAGYMARNIVPTECQWPSLESCEIHSMSMEFLTAEHHEKFFGTDTPRYELAHAEDAMYFLPYGTMVDEFQHIMYAEPDLTPGERNAVWAKLESEYRPWLDFAGLPFYGRGAGWQRQLHIYEVPFYYIDYCLAQTVALQFFTAFLHDKKDAWRRYLALVGEAGGKTYPGLVAAAGLDSPFAPGTLAKLGKEVGAWIAAQDAALNAR